MRRALIALLLLLAASPLFAASFVKRLVVNSTSGAAWNGPCPHQFDFSAEITSRRRGDALVQWIRSDGATGTATTLRFTGPNEMRRITDHWMVGRRYKGWVQLRVTDSAGNVSLSRRVAFNNRCGR
jgi:hypothetical protein